MLLDKPVGISSNGALQRVRRAFSAAKAGHVGTLDPLASGMLPICLGEATKFSADAAAADKTYIAEVLLGVTTATGDAEGEILTRVPVSVTRAMVEGVLPRFTGIIAQIPPMYSALKRDGKPLYAYARAGETVAREPRQITVFRLELTDFDECRFTILVDCSKGTYIRVLAEDIGAALGCGATLAGLRRTRVGSLSLEQAVTLAELETAQPHDRLRNLLPMDLLVRNLLVERLDAEMAARLAMGQIGSARSVDSPGTVRLYDSNGFFLGLGEVHLDGRLTAKRLVATGENTVRDAYFSQTPKIVEKVID